MAAEQGFHLAPVSGRDRELDSDTSVHIDEMGALSKGFHHKYNYSYWYIYTVLSFDRNSENFFAMSRN